MMGLTGMPGSAASFVPARPERVLVLAHGFPWFDGTRTDSQLAAYAQEAVDRWAAFGAAHRALILAPVLGGRDFPNYQEMQGRDSTPDQFVNALVEQVAREHVSGYRGRFSLHGHSAGGQFAGRYLVTYPERLDAVVISAPSTYPTPDPGIAWPYGMGPGAGLTPDPDGWLRAATEVRVTVLVGSLDLEPRVDDYPGQHGATRGERAAWWTESMRGLARTAGLPPSIGLHVAPGIDHDEPAMAVPAQEALARAWQDAAASR
jgi:pimeloyl-ACP methyl ester carboxylesterase